MDIYYILMAIGIVLSIPIVALLAIWLACQIIKSFKNI